MRLQMNYRAPSFEFFNWVLNEPRILEDFASRFARELLVENQPFGQHAGFEGLRQAGLDERLARS